MGATTTTEAGVMAVPKQVLVALRETIASERMADALRAEGLDAIAVSNSMTALDLIESTAGLELLITCTEFEPGQPNGVALMRMASVKRPSMKSIVLGGAHLADLVEGLAEVMPPAVSPDRVATAASSLLRACGERP